MKLYTLTGIPMDIAMKMLAHPYPVHDHEQHLFFKIWYLKEEAIVTRLNQILGLAGWDLLYGPEDIRFVEEGMPTVQIGDAHVPLDRYPGNIVEQGGKYYDVPVGATINDVKGEPLKVIYDIPFVVATGKFVGRMVTEDGRIIESTRSALGADVLTSLGKERGSRAHNTYKSAVTDLLKRGARAWAGLGLYLTQMGALTREQKAQYQIDTEAGLGNWIRDFYGPTTVGEAKRMLVDTMATKGVTKDHVAALVSSLELTDDNLLYDYQDSLRAIIQATKGAA